MTKPAAVPSWIELSRSPRALFLDIDGTLVEFESHPDLVKATRGLIALLQGVSAALDGALALLSGRSLSDIDRVFSPWQPHAAGVHGAEVRGPAGLVTFSAPDVQFVRLRAACDELARDIPGVWVEDKGLSLALHYRDAPAVDEQVATRAQHIVDEFGDLFARQPGVLVQEIRPADHDKGSALVDLMSQAPFAGRSPIVVGDDRTDEFAFVAAQSMGGLGVLVGERDDTQALAALPDPTAVRGWLAELLEVVR
jgi:trehalose 6-phosphate phosphatase